MAHSLAAAARDSRWADWLLLLDFIPDSASYQASITICNFSEQYGMSCRVTWPIAHWIVHLHCTDDSAASTGLRNRKGVLNSKIYHLVTCADWCKRTLPHILRVL